MGLYCHVLTSVLFPGCHGTTCFCGAMEQQIDSMPKLAVKVLHSLLGYERGHLAEL